jgi:hypothetical protein
MCGCALKPSFAKVPARSIMRANPAVLNGAPRSDVGTGRAGNGNLSTDSGVLAETPYSFKTRFENEKGVNRSAG